MKVIYINRSQEPFPLKIMPKWQAACVAIEGNVFSIIKDKENNNNKEGEGEREN